MLKQYLENEVTFTETELTSDYSGCGCPIMSTTEDTIMRLTAKVLCNHGAFGGFNFCGKVLNVGFGLGIIDSYIREQNPKEHTIIEAHPQVCEKANEMGFDVLCGKWEDIVDGFIDEGRKFDSIYFDTFVFDYEKHPQWGPFTHLVPKLLKPNGIYSYFNDTASKIERVEEILDSFGWEQQLIKIPNQIGGQDYDLVWYVNK